MVDDNPPIVDMIACKDYELGVCGKQTVLGKEKTATISFVTTKSDFKYNVNWNADWITGYKEKESVVLPTSAEHHSSPGRLYTIELTLTENFDSKPHTDSVTITSGDLSRDVKITQLGYDFRTDRYRTVQMRDLENKNPDLNQDDYFKWMDDNSLKGIRPEQNQGRVRNDGLHFFVGKIRFTISFRSFRATNDPRTTPR